MILINGHPHVVEWETCKLKGKMSKGIGGYWVDLHTGRPLEEQEIVDTLNKVYKDWDIKVITQEQWDSTAPERRKL